VGRKVSTEETIEHRHADNFENNYSSVADWYQTEPHKAFPALPADRLPPGGVPEALERPPIPNAVEAENLLEKSDRVGGETGVIRLAPFQAAYSATPTRERTALCSPCQQLPADQWPEGSSRCTWLS
jgi:hypothetical protein